MPTNQPIRIGIIGAGANTRSRHIPNLQAIPGVQILAVANRSLESANKVAAEFSIPKSYEHWTDVIADPDIDAIVIGTWPYLHAPATIAALEAGKHVLCEARMALDAAEAHAMYHASQLRPHLITQLVPAPFTFRVDKTIHKLLADKFLGELLAIDVRIGGSFLDPAAPFHWRNDFHLSGYNTMSLGIYYETILRWVGQATKVCAMAKTFVKTRKDPAGQMRSIRIPDHVDVIADLACGAQLHMQISSATGLGPSNEIYLFGSQATLLVQGTKLLSGLRTDKTLTEFPIPAQDEGHWRVEEEFARAIRGKEKVTQATFSDGVKYMDFTEAVAHSIQTGKTIALPLR